MRRNVWMALAVVGGLLVACDPAEAPSPDSLPAEDMRDPVPEPTVEAPGTAEHALTPCLSQCYATCVGNTPEVVACRQDCRDACEGG